MASTDRFALYLRQLEKFDTFLEHLFSGCFFCFMKFLPSFLLLISFATLGQNHPLVCGHRGGYYNLYPQNSLSVIDYVVRESKLSPMIVEVDLRKSKDGTIFILHDEELLHSTNGTGQVSTSSDKYLKSLFLKRSNGETTSERIPTLNDVTKYALSHEVMLMLDMKADVWQESLQSIHKRGLASRTIVLTFNVDDTQKVFEISKDVLISALVSNESDWEKLSALSIPEKNLIAYVPRDAPLELITEIKNAGIKIMCDVSEDKFGNKAPLAPAYYHNLVKDKKLEILITDYPIEVSRMF
jgi:glycerophosphoryl diester phosphodiesterase